MAQDPLLTQLAERCRIFSAGTGISLNKMARLIGTEPANFSAFVNGRIGLSSRSTIKLLQLLSLSKSQVEAKLGIKNVHIEHFQVSGKPMKLDSSGSWVPGQSGDDPNGTDDITGVKTARDLPNADDYQQETIDFLKDQQNIHRSAIAEIQKYLDGIQKAEVNRAGATEGPRRTDDNERSRTPGPRPDKFGLQQELERLQRQRQANEEELSLRKEIALEKSRNTETVMELLSIEPESEKRARDERIRKLASRKRSQIDPVYDF